MCTLLCFSRINIKQVSKIVENHKTNAFTKNVFPNPLLVSYWLLKTVFRSVSALLLKHFLFTRYTYVYK